jgi:hypothetical protein
LRASLRRAGLDVADLKEANAAAASTVSAAAQIKAPRVSGTLAGTVRGNRAVSMAVVRAGRAGVPYAGVIHWGWPRRNIRANPFLVDAAHDTEPTWIVAYYKAVQRVLDQVRGA